MITSPILELESKFMIESFQGIKQLVTESYDSIRSPCSPTALQRRASERFQCNEVKLPGEVVQGFSFGWAGNETIPIHIEDYLSRNWLQGLVLDPKGLDAGRNWWFDLYWLRRSMEKEELERVRCDILVVEGDMHLPYDREVGEQVIGLFKNAESKVVTRVEGAPFLVSVKRPQQLTEAMLEFLQVKREEKGEEVGVEETRTQEKQRQLGESIREKVLALGKEEKVELVSVYVPHSISNQEDEEGESEEEAGFIALLMQNSNLAVELGAGGEGLIRMVQETRL